jgi:hypothetical protein
MIDNLQRLHENVAKTRAAAIKDESRLAAFAYARTNLTDAAEKHLPALLRVARAAKAIRDRNQVSDWVFTSDGELIDHRELFAGLDELEKL